MRKTQNEYPNLHEKELRCEPQSQNPTETGLMTCTPVGRFCRLFWID